MPNRIYLAEMSLYPWNHGIAAISFAFGWLISSQADRFGANIEYRCEAFASEFPANGLLFETGESRLEVIRKCRFVVKCTCVQPKPFAIVAPGTVDDPL